MRRPCRNQVLSLGVVLIGGVPLSCGEDPIADEIGGQAWEGKRQEQMASRGERLVDIVGCDACHTPQVLGPSGLYPDPSRRLSGFPEKAFRPSAARASWNDLIPELSDNTVFTSPFGVRFAANLTRDEDTGIGTWSEDLFVDRMNRSQHWLSYSQQTSSFVWSGYYTLTDRDLRSIYAFLKTVPPVKNRVPDSSPVGDWEW